MSKTKAHVWWEGHLLNGTQKLPALEMTTAIQSSPLINSTDAGRKRTEKSCAKVKHEYHQIIKTHTFSYLENV